MSVRKNSPPGKQKPVTPQSLCTVTTGASPLPLPPLSGASLPGVCTLPSLSPALSSPPQSQPQQSECILPCPLAPQRASPLQPWASPPQLGDVPGSILKPPLLPVSEKGGQVYKVPSFIKKLYAIVNSPANADCITWSLNLRVPSIVVCLLIPVALFIGWKEKKKKRQCLFSCGLPPWGNLICPFRCFVLSLLCVFFHHLLLLV